MDYRKLGRTDLDVSRLCLGTMTWGTQNTAAEAFSQIDLALEHGVNFLDTAELYPTTPSGAETQGDTESIIGEWLAASGRRDEVVIATKVTGRGTAWIDEGRPISPDKILRSLDGSLKRLQTDTIDLYQLHWPNRSHYHFRKSWQYDPSGDDTAETLDHITEVLHTLDGCIRDGKIRHIGLSNETAWGTLQFLRIADAHDLPRVVSIQNEYSLMQRLFDLDLAEVAHHEDVGLLAFSPLAAGLLSGKYADGTIPEGSRRSLNDTLNGRYNDKSRPALQRYIDIAGDHGLHPAQLALAFCLTRPFMTSVIIGATSLEQLRTNLSAVTVTLDEAILDAIAEVHRDYPVPM